MATKVPSQLVKGVLTSIVGSIGSDGSVLMLDNVLTGDTFSVDSLAPGLYRLAHNLNWSRYVVSAVPVQIMPTTATDFSVTVLNPTPNEVRLYFYRHSVASAEDTPFYFRIDVLPAAE